MRDLAILHRSLASDVQAATLGDKMQHEACRRQLALTQEQLSEALYYNMQYAAVLRSKELEIAELHNQVAHLQAKLKGGSDDDFSLG